MNAAARLPSRLRRLEAQLKPQRSAEQDFLERLMSFRALMFAIYDHDRGAPDYLVNTSALHNFMEASNCTEQQIRRFVHDSMPEFEAYVQHDPEWSPLTGFEEGVAEQRRARRLWIDHHIGVHP